MNKTGSIAIGLCFCFVFAGCSVFKRAAQTLWVEPKLFPTQKDNCWTLDRDRAWAETAWQAEQAERPQLACIPEYAQGFKEGFADYLYAGGTGEPPPVPPRRFWNLDYRSPAGHKAVEAWFAGFRRGAGAARAGGFREQVTIKSSLCACDKDASPYVPPGEDTEKLNPVEIIPTPSPSEPLLIEPPLPQNGNSTLQFEDSSSTEKPTATSGESTAPPAKEPLPQISGRQNGEGKITAKPRQFPIAQSTEIRAYLPPGQTVDDKIQRADFQKSSEPLKPASMTPLEKECHPAGLSSSTES